MRCVAWKMRPVPPLRWCAAHAGHGCSGPALAIAHGGYTSDECAYLASWLGKIEPPEFGDMPLGLLEQATVPTDPLIRHVPCM